MKSYKKINSDSLDTPMEMPRGSSLAKRKVSILFIENDEQEVVKIKKTIYKENDRFNLISVPNTTEALASLESNLPNIILLDINIPNINGIEFLTILKKNEIFKSIPIVILTSVNKNIVTVPGQGMIPAAKITPKSVLLVLHELQAQDKVSECFILEVKIFDGAVLFVNEILFDSRIGSIKVLFDVLLIFLTIKYKAIKIIITALIFVVTCSTFTRVELKMNPTEK